MCKISIIVPVYNVEEYICECLDSLVSQTLKEIEIIVVDDGSTDRSIDKVEKYNDSRIKVISKENGGLSSARNTGLKIARGEYVAFVDSDDYIKEKKCYEQMYNIAQEQNSDIVTGNCIWLYSNNIEKVMPRDMEFFSKSPMTGEELLINSIKSRRIFVPVWLNIYKKDFLYENELFFKEGIFHEDEEFTPRVLLKTRIVSIYNKNFYMYRQRDGSIMNSTINIKKGLDVIDTCFELEKCIDEIKNKELKLLLKKYIVSLVIEQVYKYQLNDLSNELKDFILRNSVSFSSKIRYFILNINVNLFFFIESYYRKIIKKINV